MAVANGCAAALLGDLPFLGSDFGAWEQTVIRAASLQAPLGYGSSLILGTFLGGILTTVPLGLYLYRRRSMDRRSFLVRSTVCGIICGFLVVYFTSLVLLPLTTLSSSSCQQA